MPKEDNLQESTDKLNVYLANLPCGKITETSILKKLLSECWPLFDGCDEHGMDAGKLDRMEDVDWKPPVLSFTIERHGAAVLGSIYADLHRWRVNAEQKKAECISDRRRQIKKRQPNLDVKSDTQKIVDAIIKGADDYRLKWLSSDHDRVRILVGEIIPAGSAVKQTLTNRRKRLAKALEELLKAAGWECVPNTSSHTYTRTHS